MPAMRIPEDARSKRLGEAPPALVDQIVFSVKGIEMEGFLTDPDPLEADVKRR